MSAVILRLPGLEEAEINAPENTPDRDNAVELRRARIRIAQLEASLTQVMRENLQNFNRARDAERMLAELRS